MPDKRVGILGGGRLGQALGRLMLERGEPVVAVACLREESARRAAAFIGPGVEAVSQNRLAHVADHLLIAAPDTAIAQVAGEMAEAEVLPVAAIHTCGALSVEVLSVLARRGVSCGVLHPLQTIPDPASGVDALPGVAFAVQGDGEALAWAESIVAMLDGLPLRIQPECQALYHAAAVMASNYTVSLLDAAIRLMERAGIAEPDARRALRPLVEASVANALHTSPARALTGPIRRGDALTVTAHLEALPAPFESLYRAAGRYTLDLARRAGLDAAGARSVSARLRDNGQDDA